MKNLLNGALLILGVLLLAGCWDSSELSEVGFVTVMSIDVDEEDASLYAVSLEMPQIKHDNKDPQGAIKSGTHRSLNHAIYNIGAKAERDIFLGHMKALICGEELLNDSEMFRHALTSLSKDSDVSRMLLVLAADGTGLDIMESDAVDEKLLGAYITNFFHKRNPATSHRQTLDSLKRDFSDGKTVIIPRIEENDEGISFTGAAVMHNYALAGWLDEKELSALSWLNSEAKHLNLDVSDDEHNFAIRIDKYNFHITFYERYRTLYAKIAIDLEGELKDLPHQTNAEQVKLEQKTKERIQSDLEKIVEALYIQMGVDGLNLARELEKNYPHLYSAHVGGGLNIMDVPIVFDINAAIGNAG